MSLRRALRAALWVCVLSVCACDKRADPASAAPSAAPSGALCEHGVVAELCPKCNPALATVYQDSGDWCAEHGMPESFCPQCHPELKGRPPETGAEKKPEKPTSKTKAPADGMKVRLQSAEIVKGAGLVTVKAVPAPDKTSARYPATVVYDATRTAEVTASAGGVVRSVSVDLGARVKSGDPLATLDSAEVGGDRSKLAAANRRAQAARERLDRISKLEQDGLVPRRERVEAELALNEAQADASGLASALGVSGATGGSGAGYTLRSPIEGIITRRSATVGKLVEDNDRLFQIVDPSVVWAELAVPETAIGSVQDGASVVLTFSALPAETFAGTVKAVLPEVDTHTRTVAARVSIDNPRLVLRANMFGEAAVLGEAPAGGVTVPRIAVQTVESQRLVFVKVEPLVFAVRHVTLASRDGEVALVTAGLEPGDEVVTIGSFLLKTETLKDSIGAGCCADD